jgi:integrase
MASTHPGKRADQRVVRWREGSRQKSRTFTLPGDRRGCKAYTREQIEPFRLDMEARERRGEIGVEKTTAQTLTEWATVYFRERVSQRAPSTRQLVRSEWATHILPELGSLRLDELTPERIRGWIDDYLRTPYPARYPLWSRTPGADGERRRHPRAGQRHPRAGQRARAESTVLRIVNHLSAALEDARKRRLILENPVSLVAKPSTRSAFRARTVKPWSVEQTEQLRAWFLTYKTQTYGFGDVKLDRPLGGMAILVELISYAGLRPGEALALTWEQIREATIVVDRALQLGNAEVGNTKTGHARSVRLIGPLAEDLQAWRAYCQAPPDGLVIPRLGAGTVPPNPYATWDREIYANWRARWWHRATEAIGLGKPRPYDGRHTAASLWLAEGVALDRVARWMGHRPSMLENWYRHDLDEREELELRGRWQPADSEELIRACRTVEFPVAPARV